jgi:integrase
LPLGCPHKGTGMTTSKILNDRTIRSLKPAPEGKRYAVPDGIVPGLAVRVTDKGSKSFVLITRYPGKADPTRRALGDVGEITLADVREKARDWLRQIKTGIDPTAVEEEKRRAEEAKRLAAERERSAAFSTVVETFIDEYVGKLRTAPAVTRRLRNEVLPVWGNRSIHSIARDDVRSLILTIVKRPAPEYARSVLDDLRMLFSWAVDMVEADRPYRLGASPVAGIKPKFLIGKKTVGTRVLEDNELKALWVATGNAGYPVGPMVRMLMLTGCRLNEVAGARWCELNGEWVIPPERFKSDIQHRLPITNDLRVLLDGLPRFKSGDFIFSTRYGRKPMGGFTKAKSKIDSFMPAETPHWTFHDIRRTVRTRLSQLHVHRDVAELIIGHGKKGLDRIYNQYEFKDEIRDGIERWHGMLRSIVNPRPNVLPLRKRRRG